MSDTHPDPVEQNPLLKPLYDDLRDDFRVSSLSVTTNDNTDPVFHISTIDDVAEYAVKSEYLGFSSSPQSDEFTEDTVILSPQNPAERDYPSFPVIIFDQ